MFCRDGVKHRLLLLHRHLLFKLLQFLLLVHLAPHDVELTSAALALGVHVVAQARSTQGTALVEEGGELNLCGERVSRTARAEHLSSGRTNAVGVAALNHKVLNDAVEERAVERAFLDQFDKVIAVEGSLVVQTYGYRTLSGDNTNKCCHV